MPHVSNGSPDQREILFFHETVIVLAVRPRPGESDALLLAVSDQMPVDELTAVVRVKSQQIKG
jgi:hypothetical protein